MNEERREKVMVNGRFHLPNRAIIDIHRGMIIMTSVGEQAGFCAGVIVKQGDKDASFVLLGRLPVTSEYRQIPVNLINHIEAETIHLTINCDEILKLLLHQPT